MSSSPVRTTSLGGDKIPVFFKLGEKCKRADFQGETMAEVRKLFVELYPLVSIFERETIRFLYTDKNSKKMCELENASEIYPNCVLQYSKWEMGCRFGVWGIHPGVTVKTTPTQDAITFTRDPRGERRRRQHQFIDKSKLVCISCSLRHFL